MASGITVADNFADALKKLSSRETGLIVMKINKDMTMVNVEKTLPPATDPAAEWKDFIKTLPENDCRFILSDFMMKDTPTVTKSKIVMILWSPEYAPVRSKMYVLPSQSLFYSSSNLFS